MKLIFIRNSKDKYPNFIMINMASFNLIVWILILINLYTKKMIELKMIDCCDLIIDNDKYIINETYDIRFLRDILANVFC
jgi:hypothetical protein